MQSVYLKIEELRNKGEKAALCIIISTQGSTPRKVGAKMLVLEDGNIVGTIGGGSLERQVMEDADNILKSGKARIFKHALVSDHGMCCGGSVDIFIEQIMTKKSLYIFGAGHIGKALAKFAHQLDFAVNLIDERPEMFEAWDTEDYHLHPYNHQQAFEKIEFNEESLVAVITHDHAYDRAIVAHCAKLPLAYLGMIGSQRKVEVAKKIFRTGNVLTEDEMNKIDWPMGIASIKVQTPEEIAIAILAKLIDVRSNYD